MTLKRFVLAKSAVKPNLRLDQFKVEAPRLVETVANEVNNVILVDHNERQQSVSDIDKVRVVEVIDHHRIANFETSDPLYYRC